MRGAGASNGAILATAGVIFLIAGVTALACSLWLFSAARDFNAAGEYRPGIQDANCLGTRPIQVTGSWRNALHHVYVFRKLPFEDRRAES